jgi:hypothetical protein
MGQSAAAAGANDKGKAKEPKRINPIAKFFLPIISNHL